MNRLVIACCVGVAVSTAGLTVTARSYAMADQAIRPASALALESDPLAKRIGELLLNHEGQALVMRELDARQQTIATLAGAIESASREQRARALQGMLLWLGAWLLFAGVVLGATKGAVVKSRGAGAQNGTA